MNPSFLSIAFRGVLAFLFFCFFGCSQSEFDELFPGGANSDSGDLITLNIGEVIIPGYNEGFSSRSVSDSSSEHGDLFNEWVPIDECNVTRGIDEVSEMCVMRLCPDSVVSGANPSTRASTLANGAKVRLIAFKTSDYSFGGVCDYQVSGANLIPTDKDMYLLYGESYNIVGYTFNSSEPLPAAQASYTWNSTVITSSDMTKDFLTCSTSISKINEANNTIPHLTFSHMLSKMSIVLKTGTDVSSIGTSTDVTISNGGIKSRWRVGAVAVNNGTVASQPFSMTASGTASPVRINPNRKKNTHVSITIPSIAINGETKSNLTITSATTVIIEPGKTYTMTITFNQEPGFSIPESDITMCSGTDRSTLASVVFAPGNLIQPGNTTGAPTFAGNTSDYGHYYGWMSDWMGNGSTSRNGKDPCQSVKGQGTKWYTPSYSLLQVLSRCTDKIDTNKGMWFGSYSTGLYLPFAGMRGDGKGSGLTSTHYGRARGLYWSKEAYSSRYSYYLEFYSAYASADYTWNTFSTPIRCVQGSK